MSRSSARVRMALLIAVHPPPWIRAPDSPHAPRGLLAVNFEPRAGVPGPVPSSEHAYQDPGRGRRSFFGPRIDDDFAVDAWFRQGGPGALSRLSELSASWHNWVWQHAEGLPQRPAGPWPFDLRLKVGAGAADIRPLRLAMCSTTASVPPVVISASGGCHRT